MSIHTSKFPILKKESLLWFWPTAFTVILNNCQSSYFFFPPNGNIFFCFSKTQPLTLQGLFAFTVTIFTCMWSVAFKLQKKDEKTEDSSSASSEFSKIRKASNGYSFLGSLDRSFEQQWKKKKPHTNHSCYLQCQWA